jgi:hypothetical protein
MNSRDLGWLNVGDRPRSIPQAPARSACRQRVSAGGASSLARPLVARLAPLAAAIAAPTLEQLG